MSGFSIPIGLLTLPNFTTFLTTTNTNGWMGFERREAADESVQVTTTE